MAASPFVHARLAAVLLALFTTSFPARIASAQVATGSIVGTVTDSSGQLVPGAQVTIREVNRNTTTTLTTDASGVYTAPFLVPGTYAVHGRAPGIQEVGAPRHRAAGQRAASASTRRSRWARSRRPRRSVAERAARANRLVGGRHRHRGAGDQGTAAQRPQLRHARLPGAGHHAGPGGREPLRREHLQSARRLELQRARATRPTPTPG